MCRSLTTDVRKMKNVKNRLAMARMYLLRLGVIMTYSGQPVL